MFSDVLLNGDFLSVANLQKIVIALVIVAVTFVVDRLIRRALSRYGKRLDMEPHAVNILKLIARIIVFAGGVVALLALFNFPAEWFISISALTGAAIGFASTQTVGNFLAGFHVE